MANAEEKRKSDSDGPFTFRREVRANLEFSVAAEVTESIPDNSGRVNSVVKMGAYDLRATYMRLKSQDADGSTVCVATSR